MPDLSNEVEWRDPPAAAKSPRNLSWATRLAPLMDHPKRWACVGHKDVLLHAQVVMSRMKLKRTPLPPGRWEFATSKTEDGGGDMFVRYLGPEDEQPFS